MANNEGNTIPCDRTEEHRLLIVEYLKCLLSQDQSYLNANPQWRNVLEMGTSQPEKANGNMDHGAMEDSDLNDRSRQSRVTFADLPILVVDKILAVVRERSLKDVMSFRQTCSQAKEDVQFNPRLFKNFRVYLDPTGLYKFTTTHSEPSIPFNNFKLRPFFRRNDSRITSQENFSSKKRAESKSPLIFEDPSFPSFIVTWAPRIRTLEVDTLNVTQGLLETEFYKKLTSLRSFTASTIEGNPNADSESHSLPPLKVFQELESLSINKSISLKATKFVEDLLQSLKTNRHLSKVTLPVMENNPGCLKAYTNLLIARRGSFLKFRFNFSEFLCPTKRVGSVEEIDTMHSFLEAVAASPSTRLFNVHGCFLECIERTYKWKLVNKLVTCIESIVGWRSLPVLLKNPTPHLTTLEITTDERSRYVDSSTFPFHIPPSVTRLFMDIHYPQYILPNAWPTTLNMLHLEMVHTREQWANMLLSVAASSRNLQSLSIVTCPHIHDATITRTPFLNTLTAFCNLKNLKIELLRCPVQYCTRFELPLRLVISQMSLTSLEIMFSPPDDGDIGALGPAKFTEEEMAGQLESLAEGRIRSSLLRLKIVLQPPVENVHPSIIKTIKNLKKMVNANRQKESTTALEMADTDPFSLPDFR